MYNVYLFQPQYTSVVNEKVNAWIPYSVGAIWSYASQFNDIVENFELKDLIFCRESVDSLISRLDNPAVCGFSCYLWNRNYCLTVAERIKSVWPDCLIIFGGPEVNGKMSQYQFIDCIVTGEGEENFVDILRNIIQGKEPSLFFAKQRLENLEIPSPYLTGIFDNIISSNPELMWAMTLETNRGCPYACTFCDWGSLTYSKVKKFNLSKIKSELEWIRDKPISYLYLADANFGIFKERDVEIAKLMKENTDNTSVDLISVQNAKQSTEIGFIIGQILGDKYAGVSVAMQSLNEETLESIKRKNLSTNNTKELLELSARYQIPTYTEMILALPKETKETWCQGLTDLLDTGQHNSLEMWFSQLLENSELAQPDSRRKYGINSVMAKNYISIKSDYDCSDISENTELITSTNTMSLDDTVDSYMYGWLIIQMHIAGYSQIIAKYLRVNQISYRQFYDVVMKRIENDSWLTEHYKKLKHTVKNFLITGLVDCDASGHMLHAFSGSYFYENKNQLMDFVIDVANEIIVIPKGIKKLQHYFIYDKNLPKSTIIECECDIMNMTTSPVVYTVEHRVKTLANNLSLALIRRRGLLKNNIEFYSK